ncbi:MAG TPA: hypothetical protein P5079_09720, partial [Elusimicrobiota bacterium]|nr:hypothetical protein [Elusimicrobiota bacterium]
MSELFDLRARRPSPQRLSDMLVSAGTAGVPIAVHIALCLHHLGQRDYFSFEGANGITIFNWLWGWAKTPHLVLEGCGFPLLPLITYLTSLVLSHRNAVPAFAVTEIAVSAVGILLFFLICRSLGFSRIISMLITLAAIPHVENIYNGCVTNYNDNFFCTSTLMAVLGWLSYRQSNRSRYLYIAATGALFASMSRWEGFIIPATVTLLLFFSDPGARRRTRAASFTFFSAVSLSWLYVGLMAVYVLFSNRWGDPLGGQKDGNAYIFQSGVLSPISIFLSELFHAPKNIVLLGAAGAMAFWHAVRSPKSSLSPLWNQYLL